MRRVATDFVSRDVEDARAVYRLGKDVRDWKVADAQQDIREHPEASAHPLAILYRPFDVRFTCYTGHSRGFICMPRPNVTKHMMTGPNLGLCVGRAGQVTGSHLWDIAFVSKHASDLNLFRRGGNCLFLSTPIRKKLHRIPARRASRILTGSLSGWSPPPSASNSFRGRGRSGGHIRAGGSVSLHLCCASQSRIPTPLCGFLKSDFPRVSFTTDRALFAALTGFGARLAAIHLMEADVEEGVPVFPRPGDNRVIRCATLHLPEMRGGGYGSTTTSILKALRRKLGLSPLGVTNRWKSG